MDGGTWQATVHRVAKSWATTEQLHFLSFYVRNILDDYISVF